MSADARQLIEKLLNENKVMVFSKSYCPYCVKAKNALKSVGAKYNVIELDERDDGAAIQQALADLTGRRTVPNVFVNKKSIGGGDDTDALARSGELKRLIEA